MVSHWPTFVFTIYNNIADDLIGIARLFADNTSLCFS